MSPTTSARTSLTALVLVLAGVLTACSGSHPAGQADPPGFGVVIPPGHPVPATPLVDQDGHPVTLRAFRGKYVMLAQFLTLCQEECPLTTGAFQVLQRSVDQAGLGNKVAFVEATIDPERDTVARLHAYQQRFGADWTLLTGTAADVAALWQHFGVYVHKVPEGNPPGRDWWTGKLLTYDVAHSNGFILIDPEGNERFLTSDLPSLHGQLPANLRGLLDAQGMQNLQQGQPGGGYTLSQAAAALSWLVGKQIPLVTS